VASHVNRCFTERQEALLARAERRARLRDEHTAARLRTAAVDVFAPPLASALDALAAGEAPALRYARGRRALRWRG
jgi:hypothetical protein